MFPEVKDRLSRLFAALGAPTSRQAGALCWREGKKGLEILLVTTRRTGRWTPPKGNILPELGEPESAALEAWEEAGAKGVVFPEHLGDYETLKFRKGEGWEKITVGLYPLMVTRMEESFPEKGERKSRWFAQAEAAKMVREPELGAMIAGFRTG